MDPQSNIPEMLQSPPLAGERVSFTGTLASMTHRDAMAQVVAQGGTSAEHVSRQTTMLVIGEEGWPLEPDGKPSVKLQHAERLMAEGIPIRIVRESDWLGFLGLGDRRDELHRRCTPAMLSRMLEVSVHEIRRWERLGLIRAVEHICRLPYFDFQEVSNARRLAELIDAGVSTREIKNSLTQLEAAVGIGSRPLAQLEILAADHQILYRDSRGRLKTPVGQLLLDFDGSSPAPDAESAADTMALPDPPAPDRRNWTAGQWGAEGSRLSDEGELDAAIQAFRMALMEDFDAPEIHFHLAETLYRQGNSSAALERYYMAVELDHNYLEAWTQIGCLMSEFGRTDDAMDAFRIALDIHPEFPDAHLHLAEALHQSGRTPEAIEHWQTYLKFDQSGPWADAARSRLEGATAQLPPTD
jgi:tetratricopeptide (TPR) repeat protein